MVRKYQGKGKKKRVPMSLTSFNNKLMKELYINKVVKAKRVGSIKREAVVSKNKWLWIK